MDELERLREEMKSEGDRRVQAEKQAQEVLTVTVTQVSMFLFRGKGQHLLH